MNTRMTKVIAVVALVLVIAAAAPNAMAEPGKSRISSFVDLSSLLDGCSPGRIGSSSGLIAILQDDWGWGEEPGWDNKKPEEKKPEESKPDAGKAGDDGASKESDGFGSGEEGSGSGGAEETGARNWARNTRIGIEFGGFIPMGAMREPFSSGQFAGLYIGFGLPSSLGEYAPTIEIRLIEGMTRSVDQEKGFDISTMLLGMRLDFLFHLMPRSRSFNMFVFLGAGAMVEMSSGTAVDPDTGDSRSVSGTYPFFVVDAGIGAWLNLTGPLDLFLRLEFDMIPMSSNVSTFALGEMGLQLRF